MNAELVSVMKELNITTNLINSITKRDKEIEEFKQTIIERDNTNKLLEQTIIKRDNENDLFKQTIVKLNNSNVMLDQTIIERDIINIELNQSIIERDNSINKLIKERGVLKNLTMRQHLWNWLMQLWYFRIIVEMIINYGEKKQINAKV